MSDGYTMEAQSIDQLSAAVLTLAVSMEEQRNDMDRQQAEDKVSNQFKRMQRYTMR